MSLGGRLFWIISRACIAGYRIFPMFGRLSGSNAIIQQDGKYLVIERADGLGLAFPGGLGGRRESAEQTLHREVREETGLEITSSRFLFEYPDESLYPVNVRVFDVNVTGTPKGSWEGKIYW